MTIDEEYNRIIAQIRSKKEKLNLSDEDLAKIAHTSRRQIIRWMGIGNITTKNLLILAKSLNLTIKITENEKL